MSQTTLSTRWLHEEFYFLSRNRVLDHYKDVPSFVKENLNHVFELRPYQKEAFARFFYYLNDYPEKQYPVHLLYNMATGSGKTLIMAGLILYLYEKGYRNFLFFVNSTNIIEKTKDNFLNSISGKYLFNEKLIFNNREIRIRKVDNFEDANSDDINICFTTIQKLHTDIYSEKENSMTAEDFKDKKIVFLSDESHHGQVQTKQKTLNPEDEKPNWENTVIKLFNQNQENILLEFTATMDFMNKAIEDKYLNKVIYRYDLREFRNDKYSKDVEILRSDTDKKGRILLALILNQYRQDVANKHGIDLKPVILFKAQKTIEQSKENKELFHKIIEELSVKELEEIKKKTDIPEIKRVFDFYEKEDIKLNLLVKKLQTNFAENKCLSVNEEKEKEQHQILVNSLEDKNNQIRAIFAVQKLNEGWDVLNLYDIVRVYEGQAGGGGYGGNISPSTISEAQLIGRGARYFPFKLKEIENDKFKRKFDEDLENEMRILEELHFHSPNEHRYISELKTALVKEGIMDDRTAEKELKLKEKFKKTKFYKLGSIYLNERLKNDYSYVNSFNDLGVKEKDFKYDIFSFKGEVTKALTNGNYDNLNIEKEFKTIEVTKIPQHVIRSAIARKEFFKFDNLKKLFPKITSVYDIIQDKKFLSGININFSGTKEDIQNLSNQELFDAAVNVLDEIEAKLKQNMVDYKGSDQFIANKISEIFTNKVLKIQIGDEREDGQEEFVSDKDWYAFDANYGTSEEKACVEFIHRLIEEEFKKIYEEIYLIRNELHFKIFNFEDGRPFAPDFVLFMKKKDGKEITYQIFIEPKGKFLEKTDEWKQEFLLKIKDKFSSKSLLKFIETNKYKVIGVPFYNQADENKFKEELMTTLKSG